MNDKKDKLSNAKLKEIRKYYDEFKKVLPQKSINKSNKNTNNIEDITNSLKSIVDKLISNNKEYVESALNSNINLTKKEKEYMLDQFKIYTSASDEKIKCIVDSATLIYLELWLSNDKNSFQTISSYVNDSCNYNQESLINEREQALRTALKTFRKNIILQNQYALENKNKYKRLNYKKRPQKFNLIFLSSLDAYVEKYLNLYVYLFKNKVPMTIISNNRYEDALEIGYNNYYKYINFINDQIDENYWNISYKKFTISYLFFRKFEETYNFLFAAKLAKYMIDNNINPADSLPNTLKTCFLRMPIPNYKSKNGSIPTYISEYYDLLIEKAYAKDTNKDNFIEYIIEVRKLICESLQIYLYLSPTSKRDSWTEKDFKNAATFIKNKTNYLNSKNFFKENNGTNNQKYYDAIRELYKNPDFMSQENLELGREKLFNN